MKPIEMTYARTKRRISGEKLKTLVHRILREEKSVRFRSLHFIFVNDSFMIDLHKRYLKKNATTDVMAFDLADKTDLPIEAEIYINLDQASRQAHEFGVSFGNEALRLTAHGLLHFLGYNDHTPAERKIMLERGEYFLQNIKKP